LTLYVYNNYVILYSY